MTMLYDLYGRVITQKVFIPKNKKEIIKEIQKYFITSTYSHWNKRDKEGLIGLLSGLKKGYIKPN